jgi:hypothetical protein
MTWKNDTHRSYWVRFYINARKKHVDVGQALPKSSPHKPGAFSFRRNLDLLDGVKPDKNDAYQSTCLSWGASLVAGRDGKWHWSN